MPSPEAIIQTRARLHVRIKEQIDTLTGIAGVQVPPRPAMPGWMDNETKANKEREHIVACLDLVIDALMGKEGDDNGHSQVSDGQ